MNPEKINLENLSKSFEYFKYASEIDSISDVDQLRNIAKSYFKLYISTMYFLKKMAMKAI